jgi:hypothetical protein
MRNSGSDQSSLGAAFYFSCRATADAEGRAVSGGGVRQQALSQWDAGGWNVVRELESVPRAPLLR